MFPDGLYHLTRRDMSQTYLEPFGVRVQNNLTQANIDGIYTVPDGRVLLWQGIALLGTPGGTQVLNAIQIEIVPSGQDPATSQPGTRIHHETGLAATTQIHRNLQWGEAKPVVSGQSVRVKWIFDAGVSQNVTSFDVQGYMIPLGNWERR